MQACVKNMINTISLTWYNLEWVYSRWIVAYHFTA
uniref:Uncharacterized protein n=1 Tax=Rhizophora mucronata TaxID=61149 RepID=A0A2P2LUR0_RHIMU